MRTPLGCWVPDGDACGRLTCLLGGPLDNPGDQLCVKLLRDQPLPTYQQRHVVSEAVSQIADHPFRLGLTVLSGCVAEDQIAVPRHKQARRRGAEAPEADRLGDNPQVGIGVRAGCGDAARTERDREVVGRHRGGPPPWGARSIGS